MINSKILVRFHEELDDTPKEELPTDIDFAKEIVKDLPPESALEVIDAYTWYYVNRIQEVLGNDKV